MDELALDANSPAKRSSLNSPGPPPKTESPRIRRSAKQCSTRDSAERAVVVGEWRVSLLSQRDGYGGRFQLTCGYIATKVGLAKEVGNGDVGYRVQIRWNIVDCWGQVRLMRCRRRPAKATRRLSSCCSARVPRSTRKVESTVTRCGRHHVKATRNLAAAFIVNWPRGSSYDGTPGKPLTSPPGKPLCNLPNRRAWRCPEG